jgi:hypothetical protein
MNLLNEYFKFVSFSNRFTQNAFRKFLKVSSHRRREINSTNSIVSLKIRY